MTGNIKTQLYRPDVVLKRKQNYNPQPMPRSYKNKTDIRVQQLPRGAANKQRLLPDRVSRYAAAVQDFKTLKSTTTAGCLCLSKRKHTHLERTANL